MRDMLWIYGVLEVVPSLLYTIVVLFAMLYGTVPFKANSMNELHKLIIKGKYVLKDGVSEGIY